MANRPPRFPEFAYTGLNRYFLTICVNNRAPVFLDLELGRQVAAQFLLIATAFGFEVIAYCVMPDHFHVLVAGETEGVVRYILENPVRAGIVADPREYPLFGSKNYDVDMLLESAMLWTPPWKTGGRRRV